jgi:hypothetical protein
MLLNMKDIHGARSNNMDSKMEAKAKTIDESLKKYNAKYMKALEAPTPKIKLPFGEVLLRALPIEIKSRAGLILNVSENDFKVANKLEVMSEAIDQVQEILLVGNLVTQEDQEKGGIKPGNICKFRLTRFRELKDDHATGQIQTSYNIPSEEIDGYRYLIIDKRDIIFTKETYLEDEILSETMFPNDSVSKHHLKNQEGETVALAEIST